MGIEIPEIWIAWSAKSPIFQRHVCARFELFGSRSELPHGAKHNNLARISADKALPMIAEAK